MAEIKPFIKKYGIYIELVAYLVTFISVFLPFKHLVDNKNNYDYADIFIKRSDYAGIVSDAASDAQKFNNKSLSASYIKFGNGVCVLIFTILAAIIVSVNTFSRSVIDNFKDNFVDRAKTIDVAVEVIPLVLSAFSFLLLLISTGDGALGKYLSVDNDKKIKMSVGFYFLLLALLVAIAIRVAYIILVKEFVKPKKTTEQATNDEVAVQV